MDTQSKQAENKKTLHMYVSGFVLSIALTVASYLLVQANLGAGNQLLSHPVLVAALLVFAVAQLFVQLFFFLHLGEEKRPRWRLLTISLASLFVLIVVIGSIWIMSNLNYRMTPKQVNSYMSQQAGSGF